MRKSINKYIILGLSLVLLAAVGCKTPQLAQRAENKNVPAVYNSTTASDSVNTGKMKWKEYFKDQYLAAGMSRIYLQAERTLLQEG